MNFLTHFCKKSLNYELINKFNYKSTKKIPKFKKIVLNFNCKSTDVKRISSSLLALELITYQKGTMTSTKYPSIILKLRKGNPVGCKVELRNHKMYYFLDKFLTEVFPKIKNFNGLIINQKSKKNVISYKLNNNFIFKIIEENYYLFNSLPKLDITLITTTKTPEELHFIFKFLQLSIKS